MTSSRVERIGDATLYLRDCRDCIQQIGLAQERAPDLAVISDPPYGMDFDTDSRRFTGGTIRRGTGRDDRSIAGDAASFDPAPWLTFDEVILWGANHYAQKLPIGSTLIWLKRYQEHYGSFLSDAEIGWQRGGHGVYALHAPDSSGRRRLEFTGSAFGDETAHPFQKPIALMAWCIERVKGRAILDPFMGSGTTGVAALRLGRKFIGIEIEERWFDIACRRIEAEANQPRLAIGSAPPRPAALEPML
ncbi:MAG TPA: DNA methyltransferase [Ramlibacter sp.]|nr:DNA methyltransferase [Ramlibacter sp.]